MEHLFREKPPWTRVEWIRSPSWASGSIPVFTTSDWVPSLDPHVTAVKDRIASIDKQHKWELAKKMVNPYELVYTHDDERLPPSLSMEHPLSRSYYKMIEILHILQFFKVQGRVLRSAHVAEGPGGFIQALVQKSQEEKRDLTSAFAMTLKPNNPHVPGWKKATTFLHRNKQVRIHYGADGSGDLYNLANQQSFVETCGPASVHLFTADGGFDFSIDYSQQEQKVYHLLVCSATIGVQVLKPGGAFVLKLFDCMSVHTKTLLLLLGRHFQEWTLYKPAMTRPCNSERYFVGRGFRGLSAESLVRFHELQTASANSQYGSFSPELWTEAERTFLTSHVERTTATQIQMIELAIQLSETPSQWFQQWFPRCRHASTLWCETFRVLSYPGHMYDRATRERFPSLAL